MSELEPTLGQLEQMLLDNACAVLRRGAEGAARADQTNDERQALAFAVVDIAVAIELLLKARLAREHWSLVLVKLDGETPKRLLSGESKTVAPDEAIKRLAGLVNLDIKEAGTAKAFSADVHHIFKLRNRAAHFTLAHAEPAGVRSQLVNALNFALAFMEEQWNSVANVVAQVSSLYEDDREFIRNKLASVEDLLAGAPFVLSCPGCSQPALIAGDGEARCLYCHVGEQMDAAWLANAYVEECLEMSSYETAAEGGD